ncbi:MAG: glycosyltransferase [Euryarchaeota archaeon]|nr:glycosyltransferase [Euryarchaeota archaeon]MDE1837240.1 glycosyltransferase [Euryarchaeota archaeon]MDE1879851.1 glycosyltransferase [Euryarchaeota archaeon]MDE2045156.1 glycosyltransferase [Thermoplasmata archaeon]
MPPPPVLPHRLVGGVVAHNEEGHIGRSLRSLLSQTLPSGIAWDTIWVVASGCTDRTVEEAQEVAASDPRIKVLVEPDRRGKAAALAEVLARADGRWLVLLNGDAYAELGAVAALLESSRGLSPPFGVMGRPCVPKEVSGLLGKSLTCLWELHDKLHRRLLGSGRGTHLSDELLLLSTDPRPPLRAGVINDGAFVGAWLTQAGGKLVYASEARVKLEVPGSWGGLVRQRRRIHVGHVQVRERTGVSPTTIGELSKRHPGEAVALVLEVVRDTPGSTVAMLALLVGEVVATGLATVDRWIPGRDHVRWERVRARGSGQSAGTSTLPRFPYGKEPALSESARASVSSSATALGQ